MAKTKAKSGTVRINLKQIGAPLDRIVARLNKVGSAGESGKRARKVKAVLTRVRRTLSSECQNNRWFLDI